MASGTDIVVTDSINRETPAQVVATVESKCPWAGAVKKNLPPAANLNDIMSEELALSLRADEEDAYLKSLLAPGGTEPVAVATEHSDLTSTFCSGDSMPDDCNSDFLIAQMLQMQFNKEYDTNLKRVEQKFNGGSKVSVSLSNYMVSPEEEDSDTDEDDEDDKRKTWDSFEANEKAFPEMSKSGYVRLSDGVVTKHDTTMAGRRNACRVMEFPPGIQTGDGASFDMQLSNQVYNKLKVYSRSEEARRTRFHDKKEKSTSEMAVDVKTRLLLYKMANNGIFENLYGIIATGKESVVLYASGGCEPVELNLPGGVEKVTIPKECAVKIFKTTLNEFKARDKYIKDDYRFKDRFSKQNPRKVIHLWAEKEMHNLNRIAKANIPCPSVVLLKKHILVLEFIGADMKPAPTLKEVIFPKDDENQLLMSAYNQVIDIMHSLYKECKLVHGDLSEYNILWHENKCYIIDVSQSVEPNHPHALEFLFRDATNVINYFRKRGLENIHSPESLFTSVSGYDLQGSGPEIMNQILDYEKNIELLTFQQPEKTFAFEHCWERSKEEHKEDNKS